MGRALVCGAGGFIGSYLVKRLKSDGFWVRGVDLKFPGYSSTAADDFAIGDLRDPAFCASIMDCRFDEVYQLAADMGGAGYIFTGEHDADVMHNSATINLNMVEACRRRMADRIFYSSSACMYPAHNQADPDNPNCAEDSAYPAAPDSEYGWEKLFSERLYLSYARNHGMRVRIARYYRTGASRGNSANLESGLAPFRSGRRNCGGVHLFVHRLNDLLRRLVAVARHAIGKPLAAEFLFFQVAGFRNAVGA